MERYQYDAEQRACRLVVELVRSFSVVVKSGQGRE